MGKVEYWSTNLCSEIAIQKNQREAFAIEKETDQAKMDSVALP